MLKTSINLSNNKKWKPGGSLGTLPKSQVKNFNSDLYISESIPNHQAKLSQWHKVPLLSSHFWDQWQPKHFLDSWWEWEAHHWPLLRLKLNGTPDLCPINTKLPETKPSSPDKAHIQASCLQPHHCRPYGHPLLPGMQREKYSWKAKGRYFFLRKKEILLQQLWLKTNLPLKCYSPEPHSTNDYSVLQVKIQFLPI